MSTYESLSRLYDKSSNDIDVADISHICSQRKLRMQFNVPPTRFTPISPYTYTNDQLKYTKHQLDMRRKVEILKHDKSSTKGNKKTRKEQWAHINSSKYSIRKIIGNSSLLPGAVVVSSIDCSTVPTSSKKTDVPGPNVILKLENDVPLYNYGAPVRSYGFLEENNTEPFKVISNGEIKTFYDNEYAFLTCLKILESIDETSKLFTIVMPFSLGYSKRHTTGDTLNISGSITVVPPVTNTTQIYYSGTETNSGTHTYIIKDQDGETFHSVIIPETSDNTVEVMAGTITIGNIFVQTQPDYFYEIAQVFDLQTDISLSLVTPCLKININDMVISTN